MEPVPLSQGSGRSGKNHLLEGIELIMRLFGHRSPSSPDQQEAYYPRSFQRNPVVAKHLIVDCIAGLYATAVIVLIGDKQTIYQPKLSAHENDPSPRKRSGQSGPVFLCWGGRALTASP